MRKVLAYSVPLIIATAFYLALYGCGLEQIVNLVAPEAVSFSNTDKTFTFRNPAGNDENIFRGFELYYKFYATAGEVSADANITDLGVLISSGFFRLSSVSDTKDNVVLPLILIDKDDRVKNFEIEVNFELITKDDPLIFGIEIPPDTLDVPFSFFFRRGAVYESGTSFPLFRDQFRHFQQDKFELGDADTTQVYSRIQPSPPWPNVFLALYALSYGKEDFIIDTYSVPEFLGDIQITKFGEGGA